MTSGTHVNLKLTAVLQLGFASIVMALAQPSDVRAQLIGNRSVGNAPGNIQQNSPGGRIGAGSFTSPSAQSGVLPGMSGAGSMTLGTTTGGIQSNGRFVRGNRPRGEFVGSNRTELSGFVGAGQAIGVGRVLTAAETLKLEASNARVNRPVPPQPTKGMYYPKLSLDGDDRRDAEVIRESPSRIEIEARVERSLGERIFVRMDGSTAIVRGIVTSQRAADVIEQLLRFEPGIDTVKNELQIDNSKNSPNR